MTTKFKDLPEPQQHILLHALGVQQIGKKWKKGGYRNRYMTASLHPECIAMQSTGLLKFHGISRIADNDGVWSVTPLGVGLVVMAGYRVEFEVTP